MRTPCPFATGQVFDSNDSYSSYLQAAVRGKGKLAGLHRGWSERPRVAGRYSGCYVHTTVSGDSSDHALASDAHLHTCLAGTRGVIILLHSHQNGANVGARFAKYRSARRFPEHHRLRCLEL